MNNKKVYSCRSISIRSLGVKPGKARIVAANRLTGVRMNAYGRSLLIMDTPGLALEWCGADVSLEMLTVAAPTSLAEGCPVTPAVEEFFGLTKKAAPKAAPKAVVKEEVASEAKVTEEAPAPKKTPKKKKPTPKPMPLDAGADEEPTSAPAPAPEEPKDVDPFA